MFKQKSAFSGIGEFMDYEHTVICLFVFVSVPGVHTTFKINIIPNVKIEYI